MKVEKSDVLAFTISDVERLDPVRVMIENYEPGKGRITVTCFGKAWTGAWFAMGGDTVQEFISVSEMTTLSAISTRNCKAQLMMITTQTLNS